MVEERVSVRLECLKLAQAQNSQGLEAVLATAKRYEEFLYAGKEEIKPAPRRQNKKSETPDILT